MKKRSKKGFTLMEVLIVVAIVAIIAVIAIPVMSGSITKAANAANEANMRAARDVASVGFLVDDTTVAPKPADGQFFDNIEGKFVTATPAAYGQKGNPDHSNKVIKITVTSGGFSLAWI